MPFKGLEALRTFDEKLPSLLAEVESGNVAWGVARILSEHRAAMEAYAADIAALIAWGIEAGTSSPHRFDSRVIEEALGPALLAAYVRPVVELSIPSGEPAPTATGLRVVSGATSSSNRRQARLVAGQAAGELGILDWASREGASLLAAVLATREPSRAASILAALPPMVQTRAIAALARLSLPTSEAAKGLPREVAELLLLECGQQVRGLDLAAALLEATPPQAAHALLESLEESAPEVAEEIALRRFDFDKLDRADDRGIQHLMKEVDNELLALALKSATEKLREKFFRNMSHRASELIREEMAFMGPVRLLDVESAQSAIAKIARRLRDQGELFVLGPNDRMIGPNDGIVP